MLKLIKLIICIQCFVLVRGVDNGEQGEEFILESLLAYSEYQSIIDTLDRWENITLQKLDTEARVKRAKDRLFKLDQDTIERQVNDLIILLSHASIKKDDRSGAQAMLWNRVQFSKQTFEELLNSDMLSVELKDKVSNTYTQLSQITKKSISDLWPEDQSKGGLLKYWLKDPNETPVCKFAERLVNIFMPLFPVAIEPKQYFANIVELYYKK